MDYYGTDNLNVDELSNFVGGVSEACIENNGVVLLGGETAEMPAVYKSNSKDLVGCIVGYKDERFFKKGKISDGDVLLGLESSGPHTNGYSLINKILDQDSDIEDNLPYIYKTLLNPHKSYIKDVEKFVEIYGYDSIKGMCHITGGGFHDNLRRVVPEELNIVLNDLEMPLWCRYIQERGDISKDDMMKYFNCGIGYILIINSDVYSKIEPFVLDYKIVNLGYLCV